jgi:hypothetical protein
MANGQIVYYDYSGNSYTYLFEVNYTFEYEEGYVDQRDLSRSVDGTLHSYDPPNLKRTFKLKFEYIPTSQLNAFIAAWASGLGFDLYLDSSQAKTATVMMMKPPQATAKSVWIDGAWGWNLDLEMEEI